MGHLYLEQSLLKHSGFKVAGIRKDPAGLAPVGQPWSRFRLERCHMALEVNLESARARR
jgi:hypothetical protein